jgi:hypothetical protein
MKRGRSQHRPGHQAVNTTANGLEVLLILACTVCSAVMLAFIYQRCRRRRGDRASRMMGYLPVVMGGFDDRGGKGNGGSGSGSEDTADDGGWTGYDPSAVDWDPEEARVKRRLVATERRKERAQAHVDRLNRQLTARRQELEMADTQSAQLTARLDSARGAGGVVSMMGGVANEYAEGSPQIAAVDAAGVQAFGEKWTKGENGGPPLRTLLSLAPEDLRQIKEGLATSREEQRRRRKKKKKTKKKKEDKNERGVERGAGVLAAGNRDAADGAPENVEEGYGGHSNLLARTSLLAQTLRQAADGRGRR